MKNAVTINVETLSSMLVDQLRAPHRLHSLLIHQTIGQRDAVKFQRPPLHCLGQSTRVLCTTKRNPISTLIPSFIYSYVLSLLIINSL